MVVVGVGRRASAAWSAVGGVEGGVGVRAGVCDFGAAGFAPAVACVGEHGVVSYVFSKYMYLGSLRALRRLNKVEVGKMRDV